MSQMASDYSIYIRQFDVYLDIFVCQHTRKIPSVGKGFTLNVYFAAVLQTALCFCLSVCPFVSYDL